MKTKLMTLQSARALFRDGMTIMVGGFMGVGSPPRLISALLESGVRDLTLIANDTAFVDTGIGPLIVNGGSAASSPPTSAPTRKPGGA